MALAVAEVAPQATVLEAGTLGAAVRHAALAHLTTATMATPPTGVPANTRAASRDRPCALCEHASAAQRSSLRKLRLLIPVTSAPYVAAGPKRR